MSWLDWLDLLAPLDRVYDLSRAGPRLGRGLLRKWRGHVACAEGFPKVAVGDLWGVEDSSPTANREVPLLALSESHVTTLFASMCACF